MNSPTNIPADVTTGNTLNSPRTPICLSTIPSTLVKSIARREDGDILRLRTHYDWHWKHMCTNSACFITIRIEQMPHWMELLKPVKTPSTTAMLRCIALQSQRERKYRCRTKMINEQ